MSGYKGEYRLQRLVYGMDPLTGRLTGYRLTPPASMSGYCLTAELQLRQVDPSEWIPAKWIRLKWIPLTSQQVKGIG